MKKEMRVVGRSRRFKGLPVYEIMARIGYERYQIVFGSNASQRFDSEIFK